MEIRVISNADVDERTIGAMEQLARRCDPALPDDHISSSHVYGPDVDFYLAYAGDELVGMQSYRTLSATLPGETTPIPVFQGFLTYKHPELRQRGLTARMSRKHARRVLGAQWFFRRWAALGHTANPRVYLQFRRFFSEFYPAVKGRVDPAIAKVVRGLMPRGRPIDDELVMVDEGMPEAELGDRHAALYSTRDPAVDDLFFPARCCGAMVIGWC